MKKLFAALLVTILLIPFTSACSPAQSAQETVEIIDFLGRKVVVPVEVHRVTAVGPGALRLVVYAGGIDQVVGVERFELDMPAGRPYFIANPDLADLPVIGQGGPANAPDPEKILAVSPQVIFSTYALEAAAADELQEKTGVPVVTLGYGAGGFGVSALFDDSIQRSLELVGAVCGTEEESQSAVDFILEVEEDLHARTVDIPRDGRPRVYIGGLGSKGAHGIESTQGDYVLLNIIHAVNVVDETGRSGSVMIDMEQILAWDPDYVFIDRGGLGVVLEDYQQNPVVYDSLSAVQNGRVYSQLPFNYYNTNIDTALADIYFLGVILYPEAFADVDPAVRADEIYIALLGAPVYGQMAEDFGGFGPVDLWEE